MTFNKGKWLMNKWEIGFIFQFQFIYVLLNFQHIGSWRVNWDTNTLNKTWTQQSWSIKKFSFWKEQWLHQRKEMLNRGAGILILVLTRKQAVSYTCKLLRKPLLLSVFTPIFQSKLCTFFNHYVKSKEPSNQLPTMTA